MTLPTVSLIILKVLPTLFCTLEFENNRDIYDWVLDTLESGSRPVPTSMSSRD